MLLKQVRALPACSPAVCHCITAPVGRTQVELLSLRRAGSQSEQSTWHLGTTRKLEACKVGCGCAMMASVPPPLPLLLLLLLLLPPL